MEDNFDKEFKDPIQKQDQPLHKSPQHEPSKESLISTILEEKQQSIPENERLFLLLAEKDPEPILFRQAEKAREDFIKNLEKLKMNFKQMELDKEVKQIELNDLRNALEEKLKENASLKQLGYDNEKNSLLKKNN